LSDDEIIQLKNDDPSIKHMCLLLTERALFHCSIGLNEAGRLIGTSTHLKVLDITFPKHDKSTEKQIADLHTSSFEQQKRLSMIIDGVPEPNPITSGEHFLKSAANKRKKDVMECCQFLNGIASNNSIERLVIKGIGEDMVSTVTIVKDALASNTNLKVLHLQFYSTKGMSMSWACRNSSIEELTLEVIDSSCDGDLLEVLKVLKKNTTLKTLKLKFGETITATGWEAFPVSLRINRSLTELDLSDNNLNNESLTNLMTVLAYNSTLKTLRLENLSNVTRDGWISIPTLYLRSQTCQLESLYMGHNALDSGIFRELVSSLYMGRNVIFDSTFHKTLKKLCLPLMRWSPWMNMLTRVVYNQRSIMETFNSNHVLETISYPGEEAKFARNMSTCPLMAKNLPMYLLMNRNEQDKFAVARKKILEAHHLNQETIADNRGYRGYKTLMETILETTDDMEKTEQLPNIMAWVGRDNDGLQLMFELLQRAPTLCESVGGSKTQSSDSPVVKKMRNE